MGTIVCALCGKNQAIAELYPATFSDEDLNRAIYSARRLPDRIHYRLVRCRNCGLIFSNPIVSPKKITSLYRRSVCTYEDLIPFTTTTYLSLYEKVRSLLTAAPRVLEVGCGTGFFLNALHERGVTDVWGVEPGGAMVVNAPKHLRKRILVDVFRHGQFRNGTVDLVCCFHTLDHMVDPNAFAEESYHVLKKNGCVLVVVHDTDGLSVKLFGERSPIFDIEHIYLFNRQNLGALFEKHGFRVVSSFSVANTYPASYWWRMAGFPGSVKKIGLSLLQLLHLRDMPLTMAGGNIGLIAQKR